MAEYGQLGQGAGQIGDAGALAAGSIKGHGRVVAIAEDRLDQAGQPCARTDLDKGADAGGVHRLDLGDELDRSGQLAGEQVPGRGRIGRIAAAVVLA